MKALEQATDIVRNHADPMAPRAPAGARASLGVKGMLGTAVQAIDGSLAFMVAGTGDDAAHRRFLAEPGIAASIIENRGRSMWIAASLDPTGTTMIVERVSFYGDDGEEEVLA